MGGDVGFIGIEHDQVKQTQTRVDFLDTIISQGHISSLKISEGLQVSILE